ncbi:MAG: hypothetical protein WAW36_02215 [Methylovulum miyakonense]|uniref:hypothetical protein n=1 Tax=Methylovulum miyakonense TaxID=645578 RepID=UPI003BB69A68
MQTKVNFQSRLFLSISLSAAFFTVQAAPPALTTSSFMKHDLGFEQCQQKSKEIMGKMNLEIEDHGNGTIGGFGEQSVAVVNCHHLDNTTYVQIAVASQKQDAAELIMNYLVAYLRSGPSGEATRPIDSTSKPAFTQ